MKKGMVKKKEGQRGKKMVYSVVSGVVVVVVGGRKKLRLVPKTLKKSPGLG